LPTATSTKTPSPTATTAPTYRSLIQGVVSTTAEIYTVCTGGGGTVSDQTDAAVRTYLA
jgi:hypothetical protein